MSDGFGVTGVLFPLTIDGNECVFSVNPGALLLATSFLDE